MSLNIQSITLSTGMGFLSMDTGSWFDQRFPYRQLIFSIKISSAKGYNQAQRRQAQDWTTTVVSQDSLNLSHILIQKHEHSKGKHLLEKK